MFKVGDIVTGTEDNHYNYTNRNVIMKVVDLVGTCYDSQILRVKILSNKDGSRANLQGQVFPVVSRKFKLLQLRKIKRIT